MTRRWMLLDHEHCPLVLVAEDDKLIRIHFGRNAPIDSEHVKTDPVLNEATRQLRLYFGGELRDFDLPLDPQGTTFQKQVWNALLAIPHGETRSYSDIAKQIGSPEAVRAVGAANGRNPIPVVIPCHRVIGASGKLTGFGGGLPLKRYLLDHERTCPPLFAIGASSIKR